MRRRGVTADVAPTLEGWTEFLEAIQQTIVAFEADRCRLEKSVRISSEKLKSTYSELERETKLRLQDSEDHQRNLQQLVKERTAELEKAQAHLKDVNRQLEHDANNDSLTGARNRSYFMRLLSHVLSNRSPGSDSEYVPALFFLDFDRFKQINDTLGHNAGDEVLKEIVKRMAGILPNAGDCFARLGGDEFVLLTNVRSGMEAFMIAESITECLGKPLPGYDRDIRVSASIGIAIANEAYVEACDLLRDADIAMYKAKDCDVAYRLFDEEMRKTHIENIEIEQELETAIENSQFVVNYQPIIDIDTQSVSSMESLVRWVHPEKGVISPMKFIPLAEERRLVTFIDRIVFQKSCQQYKAWRDSGAIYPGQRFNVNIASEQFDRMDLVPFLTETLEQVGICTSDVVLEITENHLLKDSHLVGKNLTQLSEIGFKIYMDDFGTGYSSLNYLAKYPIDGIKIDRCFVRGIEAESEAESREIIRSILAMAAALKIKVVIEGVETEPQLQVLRDLGCRNFQGYLFAKPLASEEATRFLESRQIPGASPNADEFPIIKIPNLSGTELFAT
jgi:diguanylate cyclase (GGDEF)-like protein